LSQKPGESIFSAVHDCLDKLCHSCMPSPPSAETWRYAFPWWKFHTYHVLALCTDWI